MLIIPAIDLLNNEAVRLLQGDYDKKTVYSTMPEIMVKQFESDGASLIHIVDLNAAREGVSANQSTITNIKNNTSVKLELGGGIRSTENMKFYTDLGVDRFILGTVAVENIKVVEEGLRLYGEDRIVVGVDAKDGFVRTKGWETNSGIQYIEFLKTLHSIGVRHIIFTDISKDGMMLGPNFDVYSEILESFPDFKLIASGGVSSIEDLLALWDKTSGKLYGAIAGKAIYEGKLNLSEGISILKEKRIKK
ncbi:1-(5-phosphoribosyl)-5-[(5-phosphoribosylamino)methylideneamino]imidazole-4-carboxamide isomerase [Leptospira sp. 96542]|nr:1-(5-phosphoribosyl)-5-[(5-phosphoribosylamino)methylideneamino]imidazole-4-carboxamide isomerase [Leptospira sp. 96542]